MTLKHRLSLLELVHRDDAGGTVYEWQKVKKIWALAESQSKSTIFSKIGMSAGSVKVTMAEREITLHNALEYNGKHLILTGIAEKNQVYLEITAATVEPVTCSVTRVDEEIDPELKTVTNRYTHIMEFPAVLTEKYQRFEQRTPLAAGTAAMVLVVPKPVEQLHSGEIVTVGGKDYAVQIVHTLDAYKNEYEIVSTEDV